MAASVPCHVGLSLHQSLQEEKTVDRLARHKSQSYMILIMEVPSLWPHSVGDKQVTGPSHTQGEEIPQATDHQDVGIFGHHLRICTGLFQVRESRNQRLQGLCTTCVHAQDRQSLNKIIVTVSPVLDNVICRAELCLSKAVLDTRIIVSLERFLSSLCEPERASSRNASPFTFRPPTSLGKHHH